MVINDNKNLIPANAIGVPDLDRDIFIEGLMNYIKLVDESEYNSSYAEIQDDLIFGTSNTNADLTYVFGNLIHHCGVQVGDENYDFLGDKNSGISEYLDILGVKQNKNGVHYLGFAIGGDWEVPIFGMIFFNGKELCAYIPKYGNPYNLSNCCAFGNDEDDDEDYLSRYNCDVDDITIDVSMIQEELDAVFYLSGTFNGQITPPSHYASSLSNGNTTNNASRNFNTSNQTMSIADVLLKICKDKQYAAMAAFKTSLLNQGYQPYDKKLCFTSTRLAKKEDMLQDIYNYILHFDENGSTIYKSVESQKIALFIKKYKYRFEGGL